MQSLIKPGNSQLLPLKQYQSSLMDNDSPTGPFRESLATIFTYQVFLPTPRPWGESWILGRCWTRFRMLCLAGIVCSLPKIRKSRVSSQTTSISNHNTQSSGGFHKWGLPVIHFSRIFHHKPSSEKGVPPWLWKPAYSQLRGFSYCSGLGMLGWEFTSIKAARSKVGIK